MLRRLLSEVWVSDPAVVKWLSFHELDTRGSYVSLFRGWYLWLQGKERFQGFSPSRLVEFQAEAKGRDQYLLLDLLQEYVRGSVGTFYSLRDRYSAVKGFFRKNRAALPDDDFKISASRPPNQERLTIEVLRSFISAADLDLKAFYLTLWQSLLDQERFQYFNLNCAEILVKHLREKGVGEPLVVKLFGRKQLKNRKPFHVCLGHDALVAWREYFERIRGWPELGEPLLLNMYGKAASKQSLKVKHLRMLEKLKYAKRGGNDSSRRYGYNLHEFRDLAKTLLHLEAKKDGFDMDAAEYFLGHVTDPNSYDKFYNDGKYLLEQYRIAEKHLNIVSRIQTDRLHEQEIQRLKKDWEEKEQAILEVLQRLTTVEQYVAKLKAKESPLASAAQAQVHPSQAERS